MRFFVVERDTTLQALGPALLRSGRDFAPAVLARLQAANPHVDFDRLAAGTVLVIPKTPDFKSDDAGLAASGFDDFAREVTAALGDGATRVRGAVEIREKQALEVGRLLASDALTRLAADDRELKQRLDASGARATAAAGQAKEVTARLTAMERGVAAELKKLRERLA